MFVQFLIFFRFNFQYFYTILTDKHSVIATYDYSANWEQDCRKTKC